MRREERVTVQGPVKEQQPDGMSHRGGGGGMESGRVLQNRAALLPHATTAWVMTLEKWYSAAVLVPGPDNEHTIGSLGGSRWGPLFMLNGVGVSAPGAPGNVSPYFPPIPPPFPRGRPSRTATIWASGRDYLALLGGVPCAVHALCEKLAVLHHREFGKFRRLKGRH